jgi:hypothetical protein
MRVSILAFVIVASTVLPASLSAQESISPEVFAACEAKTPNDFKQQLVCVEEQATAIDALNALKKGKTRQIVVTPKAENADVVTATQADFDAAAAEAYCKGQTTVDGAAVDWKACLESEADAHKGMAVALASIDSDIPGDPMTACRNYITAFQVSASAAYVPEARLIQCLKARAPTREFGRCYQNYEHRVFTRGVTSVSREAADDVANCFLNALAGAP